MASEENSLYHSALTLHQDKMSSRVSSENHALCLQPEVMYRFPLLLLVVTFLLALVRACPLHLYLGFAAGQVFSFHNEPRQFIKADVAA